MQRPTPNASDPDHRATLPSHVLAAARQALAAGRGVVTSMELQALGIRPTTVRRLLRLGVLTRVTRGVFVDSARLAGSDQDDQQRLRIRAMTRSWPADVAVSHTSAALMLGLPLLTSDARVHGVRTASRAFRRTTQWTLHAAYPEVGTREVHGLQVVDPAFAVMGVAEIQGRDACVVAGDAALHADQVTVDELRVLAERLKHHPAHAVFVEAVALMDARTESPGESLSRLVLGRLGHRLVPQVVIKDVNGAFVARVDFVIEGTRVVVEFDGMMKYTDPRVLRAEKERELRLRRLGWTVLRLTWADLKDLERVRQLVDGALLSARAA